MELAILIISLCICAETTFLAVKKGLKIHNSKAKRQIFVDTSTLIDGRILDIARTGFISDELVIPRSVVRELQLLADGKDHEKRMRARQGLDTVNELERVVECNATILPDPLDRTPVDERLIQLAHQNHGAIMTNDYNLNKVAQTENIDVLNINDLVKALASDYVLGEKLEVKITEVGSGPKQGVGHLEDGTMVVVDNASSKVGKDVTVELQRIHRTSAGMMIFAKLTRKSPSKKLRSQRNQ